MADLITTRTSELAWGQDGRQFPVPPGAVSWLVKRPTGGRPRLVWGKDACAVMLDINATMAELRQTVPAPGTYRLYPIDADDNELSPVAHIEFAFATR